MGLMFRAGALRLGGALAAKPDPSITVPTATLIGAAFAVGIEYRQRVNLPAPAAGFAWSAGEQRGVIRPYTPAEAAEGGVLVGRVNQPQRMLSVFLVDLTNPTRVSVGQHFTVTRPVAVPLEIVGSVSLWTTGRVHDPLNVVWPTIANPSPPTPTRVLRIYTSLGAAPVATIAEGDIPAAVPDNATWAIGRIVRAEWSVEDPARGLVELYSAPVTITAAEDMRALTAADIVLKPSEYRPTGQAVTFSAGFTVPGLTPPFELRFKAAPIGGADPWFAAAQVSGSETDWFLPDAFDPAFPTVNVALFRAGEARNGRLRFQWRRSAAHPWSPESAMFAVQTPLPPSQELRSLTSADLVMGASVYRPSGQAVSFSPTFTVPGLAGIAFEMEFRASPLDWTGEDPWSPVAPLPGSPGVYHLPDVNHPSFPGFNAALFFASNPDRNARLRFRWRPVGAVEWSPDSQLFAVPQPLPMLIQAIPDQTVLTSAAGSIETAGYFSPGATGYSVAGGTGVTIDATTGVVSYATGTAGAATITVTVQPGGAQGAFLLTREAAPAVQAPTLSPLTQLSRPVGTVGSVSLASFVAGGEATSHLLTGGSWIAYDRATRVLSFSFPTTAGSTTFGLTLSNAGGSSETRSFEAVATAVAAPPANLQAAMRPPTSAVADAMNTALFNFTNTAGGSTDAGENLPAYKRPWNHHNMPVIALAAYSGDTASYSTPSGARTPSARLIEQLNQWAGSSGTNRMPRGIGHGYVATYEAAFWATVMIASQTPAVWGALAAATRTRLILVTLACIVGACYGGSHRYPTGAQGHGRGWGSDNSIRGFSANYTGAFNFKWSPRTLPFIADAWMRLVGYPAGLNAYLQSFDRLGFANQLNAAGGCGQARDTYANIWTAEFKNSYYPQGHRNWNGTGPNEAQLYYALRGEGGQWYMEGTRTKGRSNASYGTRSYSLSQAQEALRVITEDAFGAQILPGAPNADGGVALGPGWPAITGVNRAGILHNGQIRGCFGVPSGGINAATVFSTWVNVPNKGMIGRFRELDEIDEGGANRPRSSVPYALGGGTGFCAAICAAMVVGAITPGPAWSEAVNRARLAMIDFGYLAQVGWRTYSKAGGELSDTHTAWFDLNEVRPNALRGLSDVFQAWLALA